MHTRHTVGDASSGGIHSRATILRLDSDTKKTEGAKLAEKLNVESFSTVVHQSLRIYLTLNERAKHLAKSNMFLGGVKQLRGTALGRSGKELSLQQRGRAES
jgi:hypothetical protein